MSYIDENGLTIPTQAEIAELAKERLQTALEGKLRANPSSNAYRLLVSMLSEAKSETLAALQEVVSALLPGTSSGEFLTELMRFNGITRNESEYSTVSLTVTANAGAMDVPAGEAIAGTEAGVNFVITEDISLAPLASALYSARSVEKGAFNVGAGEVTKIVTPQYGWGSVTNPLASTPGRLTETDPAARRRRWLAARGVGMHHPSAIKRALMDLNGVEEVKVIVNATQEALGSGQPAGSIWPIVWGGDETEIVETLFGVSGAQTPAGFGAIGAGISSWGSTTVSVTDTDVDQTGDVSYSVGTDVPIYVQVRTRKQAGYPSDGDTRIRQAIEKFFDGDLVLEIDGVETPQIPFAGGETVTAARLYTPANIVPSHNIQEIRIGLSSSPTGSADILMSPDERGVSELALISVVGV
jgi:hypothetical protein